jgi:hypothetical protein
MAKTLKKAADEREAKKADFIDAVAEFLTTDVGRRSIELVMNGSRQADALLWARIASLVNIGYGTKEEAVVAIRKLLF